MDAKRKPHVVRMIVEHYDLEHAIRGATSDQRMADMMKVPAADEDRAVVGGQRSVQCLGKIAECAHAATETNGLLPRPQGRPWGTERRTHPPAEFTNDWVGNRHVPPA